MRTPAKHGEDHRKMKIKLILSRLQILDSLNGIFHNGAFLPREKNGKIESCQKYNMLYTV